LGHALAELGELQAAARAYREALHLRREMGQSSLAIDDLAGLARIAMAQGDPQQALEHVREIMAWIETNGSEGIEYPLQVYMTCYRILDATGGNVPATRRCHAILSKAHTALLEQASEIGDPTLRHKFLENVKANREIMAAWQMQEPSL